MQPGNFGFLTQGLSTMLGIFSSVSSSSSLASISVVPLSLVPDPFVPIGPSSAYIGTGLGFSFGGFSIQIFIEKVPVKMVVATPTT